MDHERGEIKDSTNPGSDPKFQRFAASVERALKGFEVSKEWQDLISCLARLNKVDLIEIYYYFVTLYSYGTLGVYEKNIKIFDSTLQCTLLSCTKYYAENSLKSRKCYISIGKALVT